MVSTQNFLPFCGSLFNRDLFCSLIIFCHFHDTEDTACAISLPDVGPASVMVGNLVQGNRLASAQGRELGLMDNDDGMRRASISLYFVSLPSTVGSRCTTM